MFQHPNKLFNKFFIWEKSSFFSKIVLARVHFNGQVRLCIIYHNPSGIFSPEKFIFKKLLFSPFLRQKLSVFHLSKTKAKNNNYLPSRQQQIIDWRHFLVSWLQKRKWNYPSWFGQILREIKSISSWKFSKPVEAKTLAQKIGSWAQSFSWRKKELFFVTGLAYFNAKFKVTLLPMCTHNKGLNKEVTAAWNSLPSLREQSMKNSF